MASRLSKAAIEAELQRLAPFHHRVELPYGLSTHVPELSKRRIEYTRVANLVDHAFPALLDACGGSLAGSSVLDVACNCGGFSFAAASHEADSVLGIDIVDHYIEQATFIKDALALPQVSFRQMDVDDVAESTVGRFDVVLCLGLLYHLESPVTTMRRLAAVTNRVMLVDTNTLPLPPRKGPFFDRPLWAMEVPPPPAADSVDSTTNRWRAAADQPIQFNPTETAIVELLRALGFLSVEKIEARPENLEKRYHNGRRASFLAIR